MSDPQHPSPLLAGPLAMIEEQIKQNMFFSGENWSCSICGKSSKSKRDISRHIESLHVMNHPGYKCDFCDYIAKSRNALRQHLDFCCQKVKVRRDLNAISDDTFKPNLKN